MERIDSAGRLHFVKNMLKDMSIAKSVGKASRFRTGSPPRTNKRSFNLSNLVLQNVKRQQISRIRWEMSSGGTWYATISVELLPILRRQTTYSSLFFKRRDTRATLFPPPPLVRQWQLEQVNFGIEALCIGDKEPP